MKLVSNTIKRYKDTDVQDVQIIWTYDVQIK